MEWIIKRLKEPIDIVEFINQVFELYEIRGQVGRINGISFIVHSNEQNHSIPHIHAKYGEYEISVAIITGEILAGNLPKKNRKIAVDWVLNHKKQLLSDWNNGSMKSSSCCSCQQPGIPDMRAHGVQRKALCHNPVRHTRYHFLPLRALEMYMLWHQLSVFLRE